MSVVHDPLVISVASSLKELMVHLVSKHNLPNDLPDTVYTAITTAYSKGYHNGQEDIHARN